MSDNLRVLSDMSFTYKGIPNVRSVYVPGDAWGQFLKKRVRINEQAATAARYVDEIVDVILRSDISGGVGGSAGGVSGSTRTDNYYLVFYLGRPRPDKENNGWLNEV